MPRFKIKFKKLGIKRKVLLGCIVLALILFFSSLISIFEFTKMNRYVSAVIADNIRSINTARELLNVSEQYNISLMNSLVIEGTERPEEVPLIEDENLISSFENLSRSFVTPEERAAADSVLYAYAAYMQVVVEAGQMWQNDYAARQHWFFNRLQPVYLKFRGYMMSLTSICQDSLIESSQDIREGFYRSLMPGLVSVIVGMILVLLFNYYLNYYMINPLLRVTSGIKGYRYHGLSYNVKLDSEDELEELNTAVGDIVDQNQTLKRELER
ncbi:MAG: MCP four helix bundle domain-containing protein [Bacteroidales bacterium]|nr:MCP four helix bundle domain-containing protein [Bacteroidales bacterium]